MNQIQTVVHSLWVSTRKTKSTSSGWISGNCPACVHQGTTLDRRSRGGLFLNDNSIAYSCFNCGFKFNWAPGYSINNKFKNFVIWCGGTPNDINKLQFEALKLESTNIEHTITPEFEKRTLPNNTMPLVQGLEQYPDQCVPIAEYIINRGFDVELFLWSAEYADRFIIPYYFNGSIVGYTARLAKHVHNKKIKRYMSSHPKDFVFNIDNQTPNQKYVFVVEGQLDALAINGVSVMTNKISENQARLISQLGETVIVIPDQDQAGELLANDACKYGFSIAFPNWEESVNDVADAVLKYGVFFVCIDAIKTSVFGELKTKLWTKTHFQKFRHV